MNTTLEALTTSPESTDGVSTWTISPATFAQLLLVVVCINSVGVVLNGLLVAGLVLLRGTGKMSLANVQMLLQQASVDLLTCAFAIAYAESCVNT